MFLITRGVEASPAGGGGWAGAREARTQDRTLSRARVQFVPGDSGDSESGSLTRTCLSWRLLEISLTCAWIQSCASWSCGRAGLCQWAGVYHRLVAWPVYTPRHAQRCASPGTGGAGVVAVTSRGNCVATVGSARGWGPRSWPLPWAFELIGIRDLHYHRKRDCLESTLVSTQSATKWCALARC